MPVKGWKAVIVVLVWTTAAGGKSSDACRSEAVEVPFQLQYGRVMSLKGKVGALEDQGFIVDTGLYWTVIDEPLAKQLELKASGQSTLVTPNDVLTLPTVVLPEVRLGPLVIKSLPAVVMDLAPFRARTKLQVSVFLGLHVLTRGAATLDFAQSRIKFRPSLLSCNTAMLAKSPVGSDFK